MFHQCKASTKENIYYWKLIWTDNNATCYMRGKLWRLIYIFHLSKCILKWHNYQVHTNENGTTVISKNYVNYKIFEQSYCLTWHLHKLTIGIDALIQIRRRNWMSPLHIFLCCLGIHSFTVFSAPQGWKCSHWSLSDFYEGVSHRAHLELTWKIWVYAENVCEFPIGTF